MTEEYKKIINELNKPRRELDFSPNMLENLSEDERKDIEYRLLSLSIEGVQTSYQYIPYIKEYDPQTFFTDQNLSKLDKMNQAMINRELYKRNKDMQYIDKICELSKDSPSVYSMLIDMYINEQSQGNEANKILKPILEIKKLKEREKDNLYKTVFTTKLGEVNYDLVENTLLDNSSDNSEYDKFAIKNLSGQHLTNAQARKILETNAQRQRQKLETYGSVIGGILGFAVGDALGVPVEFSSRESLVKNPVKDMLGYGMHFMPIGTWSDDTSMTIATMDSIIQKKKIDYDDIMKRFCSWLNKAEYTATNKCFDIGITTRSAIENYQLKRMNAIDCGMDGVYENGNGSLMRMLPAIFYIFINNLSEEEQINTINNMSSLTHKHEISRLGCKIFSDYIIGLLNNKGNKEEAYQQLQHKNYSKYYKEESIQYYQRILSGQLPKLPQKDIYSSGFIVHTLEACLWSTLTSASYEAAVTKAVNLGDDTDTVGAITGGINGIIYGYQNIPNRWLESLKRKDYLIDISTDFASVLLENKKKADELSSMTLEENNSRKSTVKLM